MGYGREVGLLTGAVGDRLIPLLAEVGAYVAGGAVTSVFSAQPIRDLDVYFRNEVGHNRVADWFRDAAEWHLVDQTDRAATYYAKPGTVPVQLIRGAEFFGEPGEVMGHFDFTICQGAYDFAAPREFVLAGDFLKHVAQRRLVFRGSPYPVASAVRMLKYLRRGYHVSGLDVIKLCLAVHAVRIETWTELRRQLLGIDTSVLRDLTDRMLLEDEKRYDLAEFSDTLEQYIEAFDLTTDDEVKSGCSALPNERQREVET